MASIPNKVAEFFSEFERASHANRDWLITQFNYLGQAEIEASSDIIHDYSHYTTVIEEVMYNIKRLTNPSLFDRFFKRVNAEQLEKYIRLDKESLVSILEMLRRHKEHLDKHINRVATMETVVIWCQKAKDNIPPWEYLSPQYKALVFALNQRKQDISTHLVVLMQAQTALEILMLNCQEVIRAANLALHTTSAAKKVHDNVSKIPKNNAPALESRASERRSFDPNSGAFFWAGSSSDGKDGWREYYTIYKSSTCEEPRLPSPS